MSKHSQAKILKAYADNTELHIFLNDDEDAKWIRTNPKALIDYPECEFFACLPQHNESGQCLHWLNGGEMQFKDAYGFWNDCSEYNREASVSVFVDDKDLFRIKPRKERRYLFVYPDGSCSGNYMDRDTLEREWNKSDGKLVVTEIEV